MLRFRDVAFTTRDEVAAVVQGRAAATYAAIDRLIERGFLMEVHKTLMLTASGVEFCVRLKE
jgi:hypothetical protein